MTRALLALLLVAVLALLLYRGQAIKYRASADQVQAEVAAVRVELAAVRDVLTRERAAAESLSAIGDTHEQARSAAEAVPAAVVADLRAGNLRLRKQWQGCEASRMSDAAAAARERDALAQLRDEAAGRIVRIGRDADDQLRACQAVIEQYREIAAP